MNDYTTIRERRNKLGITQGELAELCGVNQTNISRYELGKHEPLQETFNAIDSALSKIENKEHQIAESFENPITTKVNFQRGSSRNNVLIESKDGELFTSSRNVAENFGKRHDHVLRDIENLISEDHPSFGEMFIESEAKDSYQRNQKIYYMNRDGFTFLTMGFTGKKARDFKLKYIEHFNRMEKQLVSTQPSYTFDNPVDRAEAWIKEQKEKEKLQLETAKYQQRIGELEPKADYTDTILSSTNTLTITQIAKDYDMTGHGMNKLLHEVGVQYKQAGQWLLYKDYQGKGFTKSETYAFDYGNGVMGSALNTKWTQKGRLFLHSLMGDEGIEPIV